MPVRKLAPDEQLDSVRGAGILAGTGTLQRGPSGQVAGSTFQPAQQPQPDVGAGESFQRSTLEGILGNVAAVPRMALQGSGMFSERPSLLGIKDPTDVNLPSLPAPSGQQALSGILAGAKGAGNMLEGRPPQLQQGFDESMSRSQASQQANPVASGAGDALADAMAILTGRAPFVRTPGKVKEAVEHAPGFRKFAQQVWESPAVQKLASGAGKAAEAGLEGAALSILKEGDPLETAAYAAGGQAAGSLALQLSDFAGVKDIVKGDLFKGAGKLSLAAILTGSAMQFLDAAVPGDKNWLIENLEAGYDKVLLALIAGAGAGLAGAGRIKGENFPVIADAITALPRGGITSLWEEFARADEQERAQGMKALNLLEQAPDAHTPSQVKALEKGMFGDKPFSEQVNHLLETDEKYREMWDAPDPRLAGVPKISDRTP